MIAAVSVCGWFVVVRNNVLAPLVCFTTGDQGAMIEMFEDDPLYSATPEGGHLSEAKATTYDCDNGHGGSPTNPQFAQVTRLYTVPTVYNLAQLRERFTPPATAAGWLTNGEKDDGDDPASFAPCDTASYSVSELPMLGFRLTTVRWGRSLRSRWTLVG
ncbi:hypothetical protein ACTMTJ_39265 [Phytohabitans sp. LJ34]|uniref:hypothetical protein n=1 Tax=Phytohabitans sp. LJ34 TaxID=3452217 RepID=UPI003F8B91C4